MRVNPFLRFFIHILSFHSALQRFRYVIARTIKLTRVPLTSRVWLSSQSKRLNWVSGDGRWVALEREAGVDSCSLLFTNATDFLNVDGCTGPLRGPLLLLLVQDQIGPKLAVSGVLGDQAYEAPGSRLQWADFMSGAKLDVPLKPMVVQFRSGSTLAGFS